MLFYFPLPGSQWSWSLRWGWGWWRPEWPRAKPSTSSSPAMMGVPGHHHGPASREQVIQSWHRGIILDRHQKGRWANHEGGNIMDRHHGGRWANHDGGIIMDRHQGAGEPIMAQGHHPGIKWAGEPIMTQGHLPGIKGAGEPIMTQGHHPGIKGAGEPIFWTCLATAWENLGTSSSAAEFALRENR